MRRMGEVLHGDQHEAIRSLRDEIKDTEQTTKNTQNTGQEQRISSKTKDKFMNMNNEQGTNTTNHNKNK
jgi:hypothetical protein